ncbi:type 1 periplasmic-binding domain-containing protein [Algoriphagus namhaensis]
MLLKKENDRTLRIGVLQPNSKEYPVLPFDFLNGIKLYFTVHGSTIGSKEVELIVEDVGFGTATACLEKVRKLIAENRIDLIIGLLEPQVSIEVATYSSHFSIPFLSASLGESYVAQDSIPGYLLLYSAGLWQKAYQEGVEAGKRFKGEGLFLITSLLDCGYDHLRAFRWGFESINPADIGLVVLKSFSKEELLSELASRFDSSCDFSLVLHPKIMDAFREAFPEMKNPISSVSQPLQMKRVGLAAENGEESHLENFHNQFGDYFEEEASLYHQIGYSCGSVLRQACFSIDDGQKFTTWANLMECMDQNVFKELGAQLMGRDMVFGEKWHIPRALEEFLAAEKNSFSNPYLMF